MKRKYWRCRDCKNHESNNPKLEEGLEPCVTSKNRIICFVDDNIQGFCLVPKMESKFWLTLPTKKRREREETQSHENM